MSNEVFETIINLSNMLPDSQDEGSVKNSSDTVAMESVTRTADQMAKLADLSARTKRITQLPEILQKINDPNFSVSEVSRLIAMEIAAVTIDMHETENFGSDPIKLKTFTEVIKALRELGRQLEQAEVLSRKDTLNFDGPKFLYAIGRINDCWKKAMKQAGVSDHLTNSTLTYYRDIVAEQEEAIRKGIESIGGSK